MMYIADAAFGISVIAVLGWLVKEVWGDHKKRLDSKVDLSSCITAHKGIDVRLDDIKDSIDKIYSHLMDKGE